MTDKYEDFKEWFKKQGYKISKISLIEIRQESPYTKDGGVDFTCFDADELFKKFEREYCDKELYEILEELAEQTDDRNYICTDDIRDAHQKIKDLIR